MKDILPPTSARWAALEAAFRDFATRFGFSEIRTPVLEKTELFARSVGETTDIVEKEMYTFPDRAGESLTMRPEGTAPVVRALQGRLRQFHQFGAEMFGSDSPFADAEILMFLHGFLGEAGLQEVSLEINSLGDSECRPAYHRELLVFLSSREDQLCDDCRRRREHNPLRVLDCKSDRCIRVTADAPSVLEFLCDPCRAHFASVEEALRDSDIPFTRNPRMVRGLDYYRRTTFEFVIPGMGAQNTVAAGGRYDGLAEMLGGRERIPAIGFAIGVERLLMLLGEKETRGTSPDVFLVTSSSRFLREAFRWRMELFGMGIRTEMDYEGRSVKSQFRRAGKAGARVVVVFGESEAERGKVVVRDMAAGVQEELSKDEAIRRLKRHGNKEEE
jgi:histidyl-tRNA synthetase